MAGNSCFCAEARSRLCERGLVGVFVLCGMLANEQGRESPMSSLSAPPSPSGPRFRDPSPTTASELPPTPSKCCNTPSSRIIPRCCCAKPSSLFDSQALSEQAWMSPPERPSAHRSRCIHGHGCFERRDFIHKRRDFIHPPRALACAQVSVELLLSHHNDQATFPQAWIHALHERRPTPELQRSEDFCSRKKRLIMRRIISISGSELSGRAPSSSSFSCRMSIGLKPAK